MSFLNGPSVITRIQGCRFQALALPGNMTTAWVKDGIIIKVNSLKNDSNISTYQLRDIVLSPARFTDEGFYRCALLVDGVLRYQSEPQEVKLSIPGI